MQVIPDYETLSAQVQGYQYDCTVAVAGSQPCVTNGQAAKTSSEALTVHAQSVLSYADAQAAAQAQMDSTTLIDLRGTLQLQIQMVQANITAQQQRLTILINLRLAVANTKSDVNHSTILTSEERQALITDIMNTDATAYAIQSQIDVLKTQLASLNAQLADLDAGARVRIIRINPAYAL